MKLVCVLELDGGRFILLFDKENMYKDRNVLHNDLHVFVELCLFIVTCSLLLFITVEMCSENVLSLTLKSCQTSRF